MTMSTTPMLKMTGITKRFPGVVANDSVDLTVLPGQVHTLLGENGAGKSTLMKILYGLYQPDEGTIFLNGEEVTITSPTDAIRQGIGMIHQHFMLVPTLTVAENIALGRDRSRLDVVLEQTTLTQDLGEMPDGSGTTVGSRGLRLSGGLIALDFDVDSADLMAQHGDTTYGLCRPPGHHATTDQFGGYCYLNNAAIAAQRLLDGGASCVAILDVDYHHGNGQQGSNQEAVDMNHQR